MLSISAIVTKTEAMFDLFNYHFYNDELTRPAITVSPDGGRGAYGWCSVYGIWQTSGEAYLEINICTEYIDRPIGEVAATMLHEMLYLYKDHVRGRYSAESLAGSADTQEPESKPGRSAHAGENHSRVSGSIGAGGGRGPARGRDR